MSHLQESIYLADVVTQVRKGEERGMERGRGRERERHSSKIVHFQEFPTCKLS